MSLTPPQHYDKLAPRRCPSNSIGWTLDKPHHPSSEGIYPYPTPLTPQFHRWIQAKWGFRTILRSAVLETEALVTAAVNATGIPEERMHWTELTALSTSPYSFMALMRAFASRCGTAPRSFQDHDVSLGILKGRCMSRLAARVVSVMSRRPVSRIAPMVRFLRAAITRGPDLVWTVELSSR
jgi:hypothetical protein